MTTETRRDSGPDSDLGRRTPAEASRAETSRKTISRIAVGVDGYPEGRDATTLAAAIAAATGAELILVNVHSTTMFSAPPSSRSKLLHEEALTTLRELRDSIAPGARVMVEADVSVPRALHRVVERTQRDLLVVGSSRSAPLGHTRIGKRTRQLLGHFDCGLMVACRGLATRRGVPLRRIGVGYDGGPEAEAALELAASIAVAAGAELWIRGVVDDRVPTLLRSALQGLIALEWQDIVREEARELSRLVENAAARAGTKTCTEVVRQRPADALLALSQYVDLLVVGSRRWGPASRVLLGSTGEALLHDAECPVLTVPRAAA